MFEALFKWRLRLRRGVNGIISKRPEKLRDSAGEVCSPARETCDAVKGVSRRVVVVKEPDPQIFEEAIFVVREDFMNGGGVSTTDLLREAKMAAGGYVKTTLGRPLHRTFPGLKALAYVAAGAAAAVIVWFALRFFAVI